jgi:NAD(P)H-dependent FMN reductase
MIIQRSGVKRLSSNGYIFVTPEYNAGYPAVLKNAIDYLSAEWKEEPVLIVSYGFSAGA